MVVRCSANSKRIFSIFFFKLCKRYMYMINITFVDIMPSWTLWSSINECLCYYGTWVWIQAGYNFIIFLENWLWAPQPISGHCNWRLIRKSGLVTPGFAGGTPGPIQFATQLEQNTGSRFNRLDLSSRPGF